MTILECANYGCVECRETVKAAHRIRRYDEAPIRLHEPPTHQVDAPGGCPLPRYEDIVGSQTFATIVDRLRLNINAGAPTVLTPSQARVVLAMLKREKNNDSKD